MGLNIMLIKAIAFPHEVDNVNNESENKSVSSKEGSNLIMIETSAPKITVDNKNIVQTDEFGDWFSYYYTDEYDNKWYSGDVEITFEVYNKLKNI